MMLYTHTHTQSRLDAEIKHKTQLKQQVEQQLQQDMQRFKDMEREAQAIIAKARHANSKLMVGTCVPESTQRTPHAPLPVKGLII